MRERKVDGDPVGPGAKISLRIEVATGTIDSPESLDCQVFRCSRIADHAHNPRIDLALKLPKKHLDGIEVALGEAFQQVRGFPARAFLGFAGVGVKVHSASLFCSTRKSAPWFLFLLSRKELSSFGHTGCTFLLAGRRCRDAKLRRNGFHPA